MPFFFTFIFESFCFGSLPYFLTYTLFLRFLLFPIYPAIKTALKQENLNPEIEEKLLQLQRYQEKQMKQEPDVPVSTPRVSTPNALSANRLPSRKRPPSSSRNDDTDWVMETPKRSRPRNIEPRRDDSQ